ncbi:MAG: hypothetical protein HC824_15295 [Synechococcales cyanobacterium RM1_1_8]|nr:hypothetical protein [Synechococcales cyanobacterium RM1_1_8]
MLQAQRARQRFDTTVFEEAIAMVLATQPKMTLQDYLDYDGGTDKQYELVDGRHRVLREEFGLKLIVYDPDRETIQQWLN